MNQTQQTADFELSFSRLEEILEQMNSGKLTLDQSVKLYEEADRLIHFCTQKLTQAEKKIEKLMKNREGDLVKEEGETPMMVSFQSEELS